MKGLSLYLWQGCSHLWGVRSQCLKSELENYFIHINANQLHPEERIDLVLANSCQYLFTIHKVHFSPLKWLFLQVRSLMSVIFMFSFYNRSRVMYLIFLDNYSSMHNFKLFFWGEIVCLFVHVTLFSSMSKLKLLCFCVWILRAPVCHTVLPEAILYLRMSLP